MHDLAQQLGAPGTASRPISSLRAASTGFMPATLSSAWAVPAHAQRQVLCKSALEIMSAIMMVSDLWRTAQQSLDLSDPNEACRTHRSERPAWLKTSPAAAALESVPQRHLHCERQACLHWRTVWAESAFNQLPRRHWAAQASTLYKSESLHFRVHVLQALESQARLCSTPEAIAAVSARSDCKIPCTASRSTLADPDRLSAD